MSAAASQWVVKKMVPLNKILLPGDQREEETEELSLCLGSENNTVGVEIDNG